MFLLRMTTHLVKILTAILSVIEIMPLDHFKQTAVEQIAIKSNSTMV